MVHVLLVSNTFLLILWIPTHRIDGNGNHEIFSGNAKSLHETVMLETVNWFRGIVGYFIISVQIPQNRKVGINVHEQDIVPEKRSRS